MRNLKKLAIIYAVLFFISFVANKYVAKVSLGSSKYDIIEIIFAIVEIGTMLGLFILLDVDKKYIIGFLVVLGIVLTLVSIDIADLSEKYSYVGLLKGINTFPLILMLVFIGISFPLFWVLGILEVFNVADKAVFITPVIIAFLIYISIKAIEFKRNRL